MGSAMEAVVDCIAKGCDVRIDGKACFVASDVEGYYASALELMDELRGLQALGFIEVAEGAEDQAGFNAGGLNALLCGAINGSDYCSGGEAIEKMQ
jgi:hypothetical protein